MSTTDNKKTILDPFGTTIIEDYDRLYEEFGIQPLDQSMLYLYCASILTQHLIYFPGSL